MRLADLADYFVLRRFLRDPWAFVRLRKRGLDAPHIDLALRDGGAVRLRNVPMDHHTFHRIFARDEYRLAGVPPGAWDTVLDIGAHIGIFAVRVAPLARRVLSYEPAADNYELLVENVRRFPHVRARRLAIAAGRGTAALYRGDNPSAYSLFGAGVPVEVSVAAILRAITPDFPTPDTTIRPVQAFSSATASPKRPSRRAASAATAPASCSSTCRPRWSAASRPSAGRDIAPLPEVPAHHLVPYPARLQKGLEVESGIESQETARLKCR
jgi:hypothetical protein